MPLSGYRQTKEHKAKLSKSHLGLNLGVKRTQQTKDKIRFKKLGKHFPRISLSLTGKKLSNEHKKSLSLAKIGIKRPKNVKEKISKSLIGNKRSSGYKHPIKNRIKMSIIRRGEKSHFWKGGIYSENLKIRGRIEYRIWREGVFARDNWTCQKCNIRGKILRAHHIKNFAQFPELRFAIDNGITFCRQCHKKFHELYKRSNNNQEQINNFLKIYGHPFCRQSTTY